MKKWLIKGISIVLVSVMIISSVPVNAYAEEIDAVNTGAEESNTEGSSNDASNNDASNNDTSNNEVLTIGDYILSNSDNESEINQKEDDELATSEVLDDGSDYFETDPESDNSEEDDADEQWPRHYDIPGISVDDLSEEERAFYDLAENKRLIAAVYLTENAGILDGPEGDVIYELESGYTVYPHAVILKGRVQYYYISFYVDGEEQFGYVDGHYLAYSDEEWISWREKYMDKETEENDNADNSDNSDTDLDDYNSEYYSSENDYGDYTDIDFFTGSIKNAISALKEAHPNWIFVPVNTGLDFDDAVKHEMGDASWIYINTANKSNGFVGSNTKQTNWAYATEKGVRFFMDPRNYLDEKHVFAFEQLTYNGSYQTEDAVQSFLNGTFMKGAIPDDSEGRTYAQAFTEIGKSRRLSPTHLASRVYQEQGSGKSPLISGNYSGYEGYYNYFNIGASGSTSADVIKNGLTYAKNHGWNTRYKSLSGGAASIGNGYILMGQDSIYLEKFNVGPDAKNPKYTHQYMQNIQAPYTESVTTYDMYRGAGSLNGTFVFKIPVYTDIDISFDTEVELTEVEILNKDEVGKLVANEKIALAYDYLPYDTTDSIDAEWTSSNTEVAVVDDGEITAIGNGSAVITLTLNGKVSDSITVNVESSQVIFKMADRTSDAKVMNVPFGYELAADDFPNESELNQKDENAQFEGWFAVKISEMAKGSVNLVENIGERYSEGSVINGSDLILVPIYETMGKGFYVTPIGSMTYTGKNIQPEVLVYDSNTYTDSEDNTQIYHKLLTKGIDYTITYRNNKNVASMDEDISKRPTVIIKGRGNYAGTDYAYFSIDQKSLKDADVLAVPVTVKYTGKKIKNVPTVYCNNVKLRAGSDYTVSYPSNGEKSYLDNGKWPITIIGKGGYAGSITVYETITSDVLMQNVNISGLRAFSYDATIIDATKGIGLEPEISVSYKGEVLTNADRSLDGKGHYTVSYANNTAPGIATVTVKAVKGSGFAGEKTASFKIVGTSLAGVKVYGITDKKYDEDVAKMHQSGYSLELNGKTLTESTDMVNGDYYVSYAKDTSAGTAVITFTGINGYVGTVRKTYRILPLSLVESDLVSKKVVTTMNIDDAYYYQIGGVKPQPIVKYKDTVLNIGKDYTVSYSSVTAVTTDKTRRLPTITIKGRGNYSGTLSSTFKIVPYDFSLLEKNISVPDVLYSNRRNGYKTKPIITDDNGKRLTAGRDYDNNFRYYLDGKELESSDIVPAGSIITIVIKGKGGVSGFSDSTVSCEYRVIQMAISDRKVSVTIPDMEYTGRSIRPGYKDIHASFNGKDLEEGSFAIVSYGENIQKGTGTVVIKGLNDFGGTRTVSFKIKSKGISWGR